MPAFVSDLWCFRTSALSEAPCVYLPNRYSLIEAWMEPVKGEPSNPRSGGWTLSHDGSSSSEYRIYAESEIWSKNYYKFYFLKLSAHLCLFKTYSTLQLIYRWGFSGTETLQTLKFYCIFSTSTSRQGSLLVHWIMLHQCYGFLPPWQKSHPFVLKPGSIKIKSTGLIWSFVMFC